MFQNVYKGYTMAELCGLNLVQRGLVEDKTLVFITEDLFLVSSIEHLFQTQKAYFCSSQHRTLASISELIDAALMLLD